MIEQEDMQSGLPSGSLFCFRVIMRIKAVSVKVDMTGL